MTRYKLIIFDLDGTLSDSFPWFLSVASSIADKHGFRRIDDVQAMRGKTSREIIDALNVPRIAWTSSIRRKPCLSAIDDATLKNHGKLSDRVPSRSKMMSL